MKTNFVLISMLLILLIGCSDTTSPQWDADTVVQITEEGITHTFSICNNEYSKSETLYAEYEIKNNSDETVEFIFNNQQIFRVEVRNEDDETVIILPQIVSPESRQITLIPGEKESDFLAWDFIGYHGNPVESGIYTLIARLDLPDGETPSLELQIKLD